MELVDLVHAHVGVDHVVNPLGELDQLYLRDEAMQVELLQVPPQVQCDAHRLAVRRVLETKCRLYLLPLGCVGPLKRRAGPCEGNGGRGGRGVEAVEWIG